MLKRLYGLVKQHAYQVELAGRQGVLLFVSFSQAKQRAHAYHFFGPDFATAWKQVEQYFAQWVEKNDCEPEWVRIDWGRTVRAAALGQVNRWLQDVKRNYMRWGLIVGPRQQYAFTEQELNANAMLYQGARVPHAQINENNFRVYGRKKYPDFEFDFAPQRSVYMVDTAGAFLSRTEGPYLLYRRGRNAGRRIVKYLDEENVTHLITTASEYLVHQVKEDGRFIYGWHPCFGREIRFYNTLRHASTVYSMIEAWEVTRNEQLKAAIEQALQYLLGNYVKYCHTGDGIEKAYLVEEGFKEVKLGANGVLLLALTKYIQVFEDRRYLPVAEALALGVQAMQDPQTGGFVHVLNYPDLTVKEKYRVIYYDGEAAFGLMRLYGITKDPRWLATVEKAFDYFIVHEHWQHHDHWLSYCVNELTTYRQEEKYYRFGIQNVAGYLDFVADRITTFPTLLELMMAAEQMVQRLLLSDEYAYLLDELDLKKFYAALEKRAMYLLNGYFAPEIAMYFADPQRILGSFFIRHHSFRVRIDDVEHYLSGYVAYLRYLQRKKKISAIDIKEATKGRWIKVPPYDWSFSGVCVVPSFFMRGDLLCAFGQKAKAGLRKSSVEHLAKNGASAIMTEDSSTYQHLGKPLLEVRNVREAVLSLGEMVRNKFAGTVIGITGSAGKTTLTHHLAHVLQRFGLANASRGSANVPYGVSWNMCSMRQDADFWCVEMAIGNMKLSTMLVRPHIAVVTNIAPAHLEYHDNLENIAHRKARIFSGMSIGGIAILFKDMPFYEVFAEAAQRAGLRAVSFGECQSADICLLSLEKERMSINAFGEKIQIKAPSSDKRDIYNHLAILAVLHGLSLSIEFEDEYFYDFVPVSGRNSQRWVRKNGQEFLLIDDAYNANPLSMAMALDAVASIKKTKLLVLGDMLELGTDSRHYHEALFSEVVAAQPESLILCGTEMKHLWHLLRSVHIEYGIKRLKWFATVEDIISEIDEWVPGQEVVFLKGSNSIQLDRLVHYFLS